MIAYKIRIQGAVQGVGFRYEAKAMADELGVAGIVRNEPDGSVYLEAEGEPEPIRRFLEWCRKGPVYAKINIMDAEESGLRGYSSFDIEL